MALRDIDRLIEMGLSRYGAGDLDSALLLWEEALAIEPDNAQASSYVDYVRLNYEVLSNDNVTIEPLGPAPFGIEEEPEYQIEILPGEPEVPPQTTEPQLDSVDDGWFDDASAALSSVAASEASAPSPIAASEAPAPSPPETLELDADEPPPAPDFEDATREYQGMQRPAAEAAANTASPPDDLDDGTAGPTQGFFRGDELSGGATQGFFRGDEATSDQQIAEASEPGFETESGTSTFQNEGTPGFSNLQTEVRKRDLGFVKPVVTIPPKTKPAAEPGPAPISIGTAPTMDLISLEQTAERDPTAGGPPTTEAPDDDDLLSSLPTPGPVKPRDMTDPARQPARLDSSTLSQAEVMLSHAPTRELGLRAAAAAAVLPNPADDDAPTGQTDVRSIREAARRNDGDAARDAVQLRDTVSLDPIAMASAEILDEVDAGAPASEAPDERTRRRITRLLEKAAELEGLGQYDRAAMAAELVFSEDPDSALAQKLVTRNRDTISSVFQNYLGDLERMPRLARSLSELSGAQISPRAAFLLSRIDGMLTIDELLDVSGMPRLEAYRYLCQLYLSGILR